MKKILCITSHDLNAQDYGPVLRNRHIFKRLSELGDVRIVLASRHEKVIENARRSQGGFELVDKIHLPSTRYDLVNRIRGKFNSRHLDIEGWHATDNDTKRLFTWISKHDLVWVHGLETANSFDIWRWPHSVLDVDDIASSVYRLRMSQSRTFAGRFRQYRKMVLWTRAEKFLTERFDAVCVCSPLDREKLGGSEKVFVLPNGFDAPKKLPIRPPSRPPQIGFVGTFVYWANCDGVRWFIQNVWPAVLAKFPQARLRLAGEGGQNIFKGQNIDALGWVEDMETEMGNWSLAIVPLLAGGGTRIKILEAFSRKCPVVSTAIGAFGHDVENGRDILIGNSPKEFAENCLRIIANPSEGERLADNAWKTFLENGQWDSQTKCIHGIVRKIWADSHRETNGHTEPHEIHSKRNGNGAPISVKIPATTFSPQVSVIIPVFNRAHCVGAAVESVLAQSFKDLEIIAVDDGSSDGTADVLKRFGSRVRLTRQKNRGVSAARNTGVRMSRGKWISFLDSDDRWHPEKLKRQINALEKYDARICFTRSVNAKNELLRDIDFISSVPKEPEIFYVQNGIDSVCLSPRHPLVQTMVAERKVLEEAGLFDQSFHAAEDAELIFRLSFISGFLYVDHPLTTIFEHSPLSLTYTEELQSLARRNQSYLRLLAHMYWRLAEIAPEKLPVMRKRLGYFISRRAEIACAAGQLPVARLLARDGIFFAGSLRDFMRCAGILLLPNLVRIRAQKKWPA